MLSEESTSTVCKSLNCPAPEPVMPHFVVKVPLESNFWIRSFPESATYTLFDESVAMPIGPLNCPSPEPAVPAWHVFPDTAVQRSPVVAWLTPLPQVRTKL